MKQAASEDIELSGQIIEVLAVVLEVGRLKLTQGIVNLGTKNYNVEKFTTRQRVDNVMVWFSPRAP